MSDPFDELRRQIERINALPEPVSYIVLDPNWSPLLPHVDGHDGKGRRYVIFSPAVLDEMKHQKYAGINIISGGLVGLGGIPIYRRADMPEGWPEC